MAKKPRHQEIAEAERVDWYKWEFLRRNDDYRTDYESLVHEFGAWFDQHGYWYDHSADWGTEDWRFFTSVIAPRAHAICERWQVMDPFSPDWKFDLSGMYEYKPTYHAFLPTAYNPTAISALWENIKQSAHETSADIAQRAPVAAGIPTKEDRDRYFDLHIDLTRPRQELLREARKKIILQKERFAKAHPPARITPATRRRLDRYDRYLAAWDLRTQGEKFEVIGAELFRGQPRAAQRALDSFRRAQELIGGGYKELR